MWWFDLERKYQQWQQGNLTYINRYMEFVELIARENNSQLDIILQELEKYPWFRKP